MSSDRDEIWTPAEIAERWKISARTVRDMLEQRELPGFKVRREWRIYLSDVLEYEKRSKKTAAKKDVDGVVMMMPRAVVTRIR